MRAKKYRTDCKRRAQKRKVNGLLSNKDQNELDVKRAWRRIWVKNGVLEENGE